MHNSQELARFIKTMAKSKKITIGKMLTDCGLGINTLSSMQSGGYFPRLEAIAKIADYLDCSLDYLLGRDTYSNQNINAGDITNSNVISGNNNTLQNSDTLSKQEKDLIKIYRASDGRTQTDIMQFVYDLNQKNKN